MCMIWYLSSFNSSNKQCSNETLVYTMIRTFDPFGIVPLPRTLPPIAGLQHVLPCRKDFSWVFIAQQVHQKRYLLRAMVNELSHSIIRTSRIMDLLARLTTGTIYTINTRTKFVIYTIYTPPLEGRIRTNWQIFKFVIFATHGTQTHCGDYRPEANMARYFALINPLSHHGSVSFAVIGCFLASYFWTISPVYEWFGGHLFLPFKILY
jgi:hypothetical protein